MIVKDLIQIYSQDSVVSTLIDTIKNNEKKLVQLAGVVGSFDSLLISVITNECSNHALMIVNDREEARFLINDLQNLMPDKQILLFPNSYKKPYSFDETDNANVLLRAEVLNRLGNPESGQCLVITYPEALTEKVVSKKTLVENTLIAKVGQSLDVNFIQEVLSNYEFEINDFVFEPGQYSIRGGIIDVFSFANEYPYRIELFGNEIESIRTFDPNTQLSVENKKFISIIPNVQTKLIHETTTSFLDFFDIKSLVYVRDLSFVKQTLKTYFEKATDVFDSLMKQSNNTQIVVDPKTRFEEPNVFIKHLKNFQIIEFVKKKSTSGVDLFLEFNIQIQPNINKDFALMSKHLAQNQAQNIVNLIVTDSPNQFDKLSTIIDELDPYIKISHLSLALREGFIDKNLQIAFFTDHQLFGRHFRYKSQDHFSKSKAITLKELKNLQAGDFVTHVDYGVAKFVGLEKLDFNGKQQESIRLLFRDDDLLKVSIHQLHKISKYSGKEGNAPQMSKLGSPEWENKKKAAKKKVKDIAKDLISLYAKRKAAPGFAFSPDNYLQAELETSFMYEDTPDQSKATIDVKADMEKQHPMDRLVCGDVGFGKTEIAMRAAFKAVCDSKQVAVLVPTTILAMQHYKNFKARFEKFPVKVDYVSRFKTTQQVKEILKKVAEGKIDILIGTHRLVSKDVKFKDLGLMIIDEEQKFGVTVKEKLKEMKVNLDTLTLTATPIPRTLHFSLMGARDLSIIATPPPNRQPVTTEVHVMDDTILRDAVSKELERGGQVFMVHNRVNDIEAIANKIFKLVPDAKIGFAHGQMEGEQLEKAMLKFIEGEYDVLVSTNIIESGLDIPNANTIIINQAHHFGLSDLHQMRGRVGRSNRKAYCYLLAPHPSLLTSDARKKLSTLEEFSDLGDGFKVAMRDLDIRGAGNLLGGEQSGFVTDLGFDMYHKILDEAIQELKETEFKDLFATELSLRADMLPDCAIETDLAILLPETYIANISERLGLYNELDSIKNEESLLLFEKNLKDRFGPLPEEVKDLTETVRLRWVAEKIGFEKLTIKGKALRCTLAKERNNADFFNSDMFGNILDYIKQNPKTSTLKELSGKIIIVFEHINSIAQAEAALLKIAK